MRTKENSALSIELRARSAPREATLSLIHRIKSKTGSTRSNDHNKNSLPAPREATRPQQKLTFLTPAKIEPETVRSKSLSALGRLLAREEQARSLGALEQTLNTETGWENLAGLAHRRTSSSEWESKFSARTYAGESSPSGTKTRKAEWTRGQN
jgi:hypothetical protein